jgi:hypothetical protein
MRAPTAIELSASLRACLSFEEENNHSKSDGSDEQTKDGIALDTHEDRDESGDAPCGDRL